MPCIPDGTILVYGAAFLLVNMITKPAQVRRSIITSARFHSLCIGQIH